MRDPYWLVALFVIPVSAASSHVISLGTDNAVFDIISEYLNLVSQASQNLRDSSTPETCDLSQAILPHAANATALAPPSSHLTLKHVAIGRGTQNYTCATSTNSSAPNAVGALATLYNATCTAALYPAILNLIPSLVLSYNLSSTTPSLFPTSLLTSGQHYFTTTTTPTFNLDTMNGNLGIVQCSKNASTPAPTSAVKGQGFVKTGAVPWLKLKVNSVVVGSEIEEVYRVNTAGGSAPGTCEGMETSFEVQYAAEYWFYG